MAWHQRVVTLTALLRANQTPSDLGKRESSSAVESLGMEQPGAAMYLGPACERACVHWEWISSVVSLRKSISSTPPRMGCAYFWRTSEMGMPLTFTEY